MMQSGGGGGYSSVGGGGGNNSTYSRFIPKGWKMQKVDKSFDEVCKENGWTYKMGSPNSSFERTAKIYDSDGNLIGEAHFGHKVYYGPGNKRIVTQDHYHLKSDKDNIHYVLPDKK